VPQLVLPQGADQFANAAALVEAGVAARLEEATASSVAEHARALLAPGPHREAVRALAAEIAAMPAPAEVARRLPRLAAEAP
jgi:UDP:flavonoid glycosyltransferase YjiC (YdhE family)